MSRPSPRAWWLVAGAGALLAAGIVPSIASQPRVPTAAAPARIPPTVPVAKTGPAEFVLAGEQTQGGWLRGTAPGGTAELTFAGQPVAMARDGSFLIAFDRDAPPTMALTAKRIDGRVLTRTLSVAPRAWAIEHVNIARSPGGATDAFMALRRPELARIAEARKINSDSDGWRQHFIWPVKGRVSGNFGSQRIYRGGEPGAYHSGTDIAGGSGTVFVAPADGVVVLAAETPFTLEGHLLMIDHGMGLNSAFLHSSQLLVKEGDRVRQGQPIGRIGMTGRATGPHLHWSIKWRDSRLDPVLFTGPMR